MKKNIKTIGGIQLNSWILSPSFSSFNSENETRSFTKKKENFLKEFLNMRYK